MEKYFVELTEKELDVINVALEVLNDLIDEGTVKLEMSEDEAYELGYIMGTLTDLADDEDEDE